MTADDLPDFTRTVRALVAENDRVPRQREPIEDVRPAWGTEDYRRYAVLFNDITFAYLPSGKYFQFSDRHALADHLWAQGWRREVRPEDVTTHETAPAQPEG